MSLASAGGAARRAVVTGTSSGIGAAIAARMLAEGWIVHGLDRAPPTIAASGFQPATLDLTDAAALAAALAALPDPAALVHAAGFMRTAPIGALDHDGAAAMWRLHVEVAAWLADAVAPRLGADGRIVLIGSRTAAGAAGRSAYAATKAALVGMARSWALELAPRGITVNVIAPGATDTPMLRDPGRAGVAPRLPPIGRFVRPEEVAALAAFLLSRDAGAITGQQMLVCGGASL
ncbi:MAG: SDR family oxidoreductase [Rhodospirillales bacterium]|nr:SDR family oxidoreductase [Rhodospirillales bacterium]